MALYVVSVTAVALANGVLAWRAYRCWRDGCAGNSAAAHAAVVAGAPVILVCGGEPCRDELGARLAAGAPGEVLAFFSSGHYKLARDFDPDDEANPHRAKFTGVDYKRLQAVMVLDRDAIDTLANFTSLARHLRRHGSRPWAVVAMVRPVAPVDVVVVTSPYHAWRAGAVAALVLGSQGLSFVLGLASPGEASSSNERAEIARRAPLETRIRCTRDVVRAVLWVLTGFEGDAVAAWVHTQRRDFRTWHRSQQKLKSETD